MRSSRHLSAGLVVALLAVAAVGIATGAGSTDVTLTAGQTSIETGERTNLTVTVESANGGVGSMDLGIVVSNPNVVNVTANSIAGAPQMEHVSVADGTIEIAANGMNTTDDGRVQVATLTVEGARAGETALDLEVTALGDEDGSSYETTAIDGPTLSVVDPGSTGGDEDEGRSRDDADDDREDDADDTDADRSSTDGSDEDGAANTTESGSENTTGTASNETGESPVESERATDGVLGNTILLAGGVLLFVIGVIGIAFWREVV